MGLRGLIKKKGDDADDLFGSSANPIADPLTTAPAPPRPLSYEHDDDDDDDDPAPGFTIIRSDTHTQEVVYPPEFVDAPPPQTVPDAFAGTWTGRESNGGGGAASKQRHSFGVFRRTASVLSKNGNGHGNGNGSTDDASSTHSRRRLSHRLHLGRTPSTSAHVPANLPDIVVPEEEEAAAAAAATATAAAPAASATSKKNAAAPATPPVVEAQWEKRATILALGNGSPPNAGNHHTHTHTHPPAARRGSAASAVSSKELDDTIQEAIRLHEAGQLEQSTALFGRLADPHGQNNPLSQVLYGLALRHGWGCVPNTEQAVRYLSAAASNAAAVEELALQAGLRKGGAAKGELVLAIFELANCFRHGWGLEKDPLAAKQYYETAANLGDTDAMNEAAWCYLEGFGCKKDKFLAAKYYRLAEQSGNKTLGNTWIWKEKYDPDKQKKKK